MYNLSSIVCARADYYYYYILQWQCSKFITISIIIILYTVYVQNGTWILNNGAVRTRHRRIFSFECLFRCSHRTFNICVSNVSLCIRYISRISSIHSFVWTQQSWNIVNGERRMNISKPEAEKRQKLVTHDGFVHRNDRMTFGDDRPVRL